MRASLERLRRSREESREGGFTLIELLIVIVILAILAAIVVFAVQNLASQSAVASCQTDFKTVETASEAYFSQVGVYPGQTLPSGETPVTPAVAPANSNSTGITAMFQTITLSNNTTVGPWLKDVPYNPGHYQIVMGSISTNPAWTGAPSVIAVYTSGPPASATAIPSTPADQTFSAADCTGVK